MFYRISIVHYTVSECKSKKNKRTFFSFSSKKCTFAK